MKNAVEMVLGGMIYITMFHDGWLRHSSIIMVITSTILEAAVFIPLMARIYEVHC
jgi:hypothetical protein